MPNMISECNVMIEKVKQFYRCLFPKIFCPATSLILLDIEFNLFGIQFYIKFQNLLQLDMSFSSYV